MLAKTLCARLAATLILLAAMLVTFGFPASAAEGSRCLALASGPTKAPYLKSARQNVVPVRLIPAALGADLGSDEVRITYITHSTFRIETPGGIAIATDYSGVAGPGRLPDAVTMNHAHETHYTDFPDPEIPHVLRGWNPEGGPARHKLRIGDVLIRNLPTDTRGWDGGREEYGNSIFIFEVADLCIGHLGHLHHELTPADLAGIGQLDIVMAPVDAIYTVNHPTLVRTLKVLKSRIVIPMHALSSISLANFVETMSGDNFAVNYLDQPQMVISAARLPDTPTVMVLPETHFRFWE